MDIHQAAKLLHYSERHVKKLAKEGKLPCKKIKIKHIVTVTKYEFPDDLLDWVNAGGYTPYEVKGKRR